jgi:probable F420-dependent oxidoreductase
MKFWTYLQGLMRYPPATQPWEDDLRSQDFQTLVRHIDRVGYDAIAVPEHIVMPLSLGEAMGHYWLEALTTMAFIAGATERVAVNCTVSVLPYHHPVVYAKAIATLDVMSGGRVMMGFGAGHAQEEFEALGVPFADRGRMTDEYRRAMRELWSADRPTFEGEWVRFSDIAFEPKPVSKPHPPIWIGGNSKASIRRAVRYGDAWNPWQFTVEELPPMLEYLYAQPEYQQRDRPFDIAVMLANPAVNEEDHRPNDGTEDGRAHAPIEKHEIIDVIGRAQDAGVTWCTIPAPMFADMHEYMDWLQWAAEEILPVFR